jgi:hypothetical protein
MSTSEGRRLRKAFAKAFGHPPQSREELDWWVADGCPALAEMDLFDQLTVSIDNLTHGKPTETVRDALAWCLACIIVGEGGSHQQLIDGTVGMLTEFIGELSQRHAGESLLAKAFRRHNERPPDSADELSRWRDSMREEYADFYGFQPTEAELDHFIERAGSAKLRLGFKCGDTGLDFGVRLTITQFDLDRFGLSAVDTLEPDKVMAMVRRMLDEYSPEMMRGRISKVAGLEWDADWPELWPRLREFIRNTTLSLDEGPGWSKPPSALN